MEDNIKRMKSQAVRWEKYCDNTCLTKDLYPEYMKNYKHKRKSNKNSQSGLKIRINSNTHTHTHRRMVNKYKKKCLTSLLMWRNAVDTIMQWLECRTIKYKILKVRK